MQWDSMQNVQWAEANCRMVRYIGFHPRGSREPIASCYGLDQFKEKFAMRARTQLRLASAWSGRLLVYSDDGFQLDVHEIGQWNSTQDRLLQDYRIITRMAHPRGRACQGTISSELSLQTGKMYMLDAKYWQGTGSKCFKV
jgi:hypothetical protein